MAKQNYNGLDALRWYAAVLVVLLHARTLMHMPWLVPSGYLSVDLFFLISGFVIAHSYDAKSKSMGFGLFLAKRFIRFYPLYVLGLALGLAWALLMLVTGHDMSGAFLAVPFALLFLPSPPTTFSMGAVAPLDSPGWSLIFEVWINAAYALVLNRMRWRWLICFVGLAGTLLVVVGSQIGMNGGYTVSSLHIGVLRVCFSFPAGVLIYRYRAKLPRFASPVPVLGIGLFLYFLLPGSPLHDLVFVLVLSPAIVLAASREHVPPSIAANFGQSSSYALYVIHYPVLGALGAVSGRLGINIVVLTAAVVISLLMLCPLLDRFYDQPIRRWLDRGLKRKSEALVAS